MLNVEVRPPSPGSNEAVGVIQVMDPPASQRGIEPGQRFHRRYRDNTPPVVPLPASACSLTRASSPMGSWLHHQRTELLDGVGIAGKPSRRKPWGGEIAGTATVPRGGCGRDGRQRLQVHLVGVATLWASLDEALAAGIQVMDDESRSSRRGSMHHV